MVQKFSHVLQRLQIFRSDQRLTRKIAQIDDILAKSESTGAAAPVLFFNASTRIHRLSLNAAFSLLTSWKLRQSGTPVGYLVCDSGMVQCVLGTNPDSYSTQPPCARCWRFSRILFPEQQSTRITLDRSGVERIGSDLEKASFTQLLQFDHKGYALGQLCLPGLQWAFRRYHLLEDETTRNIYLQYLSSGVSLVDRFEAEFERIQPQALVVFNGVFYPEAIARAVAQRRGIPVITHEVGLRPFSAFFSHDHATFRQVETIGEADLSAEKNEKLDAYLSARFRGEFSMAGVRFWQGIEGLPTSLIDKISSFRQVVSVFGNVIFDTSQLHANTIYDDMFVWLDDLVPIIESHPDILFILRAHPDENRAGKASRETISQWFSAQGLQRLANVEFIGADESLDSYELIEASDLVLIYNSSIGLEAAILGKPVLAAGRARFSGQDAVIDVKTVELYHRQLENLLSAPMDQATLETRKINARKFLFHELYEASLDLSYFLQEDPYLEGMAQLSDFGLVEFEKHEALSVIQQGVLHGTPFRYGS